MPLYWGEYLGVNDHLKDNSFILSNTWWLRWTDKLSRQSIMLSNGLSALKFSKNILNLETFRDFGNIIAASTPRSFNIAATTSRAPVFIYYQSIEELLCFKAQSDLGKTLFVYIASSIWSNLKPYKMPARTSSARFIASSVALGNARAGRTFPTLTNFFLILFSL